jgi:hypothetical protein
MKNIPFAFPSKSLQLLIFLTLFSAPTVFGAGTMFQKIMDFDGDQRADFAVVRVRGSNMSWHIYQSTEGYKVQKWGLYTDTPVAGDYDGDGKTDLAIYRGSYNPMTLMGQYSYYILRSQTNSLDALTFQDYSFYFDSPTQQDYDGDGKTDPGTYYGEFGLSLPMQLRLSSGGFYSLIVPSANSLARIGDTDGDGRADLAYLNSYTNVLTMRNIDFGGVRTVDISSMGGFLVPGDFDGDGKGDIAVWRSSDGVWLWIRSSDNVVQSIHFGANGDRPVPADYDGDGKTDQAIWRPGTSQSYYWINQSRDGLRVFPWGISTDMAIRY